ncbi:hypothetical protein [Providencia alcalifaciens]|uniref:hypothetical protein n=1 Tax=Providencia alcalifaciens TaxID=126385 RepID=UPI00029C5A37|nr:hypothetical protein [Providencia alcalifaciens]EKT65942.1 hypothetical protein OO9_08781 [Providencia alcalifaciens Dmel2]MTC30782.1 hypothetical protein [Providencia alcalifaciens]
MRKFSFLMLFLFSLHANSTESLDAINKLTDSICDTKLNQDECEKMINALVSLSIYNGYAAGVCTQRSEYYNQYNPDCKKAQDELKSLLEKYKEN